MCLFLLVKDISQEVEVIFVNDGSRNDSQSLLREAARTFPFVKVIELSRNFGQHVAVSCGYRFATGDYVAMINVDMQDPPDQIPVLVRRLRVGDCDIVLGLREKRQSPWHEHLTSRAFNALLNALTGAETPLNAASLRMMTRPFVDAYNTLNEKTPFIPGLENWLGFKHGYVTIRHQARTLGKSSYTFRKRLHMATESIIGFSDLPLRLAAALGCGVTFVGVILIAGLALQRLFFAETLPGYTSTLGMIVLLGGANLMFLGLVGLYVGRILREVQDRPRYVIKSFENLPARADDLAANG
ncbi:MAG: glycosyltransferase family 2 protein [Bryobacterales bacterium]|nr:glycosyltransferase family 2 protein [Bryobacterales bacterium]